MGRTSSKHPTESLRPDSPLVALACLAIVWPILVASSILAANLFLNKTWRRLALIAIIIPLGILRNGFRIFVIGLLCVHMGPEMIHSLIHRRGGPLFFVVSLVPLLLVLWLLRKGDQKGRFAE